MDYELIVYDNIKKATHTCNRRCNHEVDTNQLDMKDTTSYQEWYKTPTLSLYDITSSLKNGYASMKDFAYACWVCQQWCWWDRNVDVLKLVTFSRCWWQNFDLRDIFWMLARRLCKKESGRWWPKWSKLSPTCCNILKLSSTHFVFNIRLHYRYNLCQPRAFIFQYQWPSQHRLFRFVFSEQPA